MWWIWLKLRWTPGDCKIISLKNEFEFRLINSSFSFIHRAISIYIHCISRFATCWLLSEIVEINIHSVIEEHWTFWIWNQCKIDCQTKFCFIYFECSIKLSKDVWLLHRETEVELSRNVLYENVDIWHWTWYIESQVENNYILVNFTLPNYLNNYRLLLEIYEISKSSSG